MTFVAGSSTGWTRGKCCPWVEVAVVMVFGKQFAVLEGGPWSEARGSRAQPP
jgi:hypothetical protein